MRSSHPPDRVLIVCLGNICRSPTVEGVLRHLLAQTPLAIEVDSAGTARYHVGSPPDPRSIHHARLRGYDLSSLRARQVERQDFERFDLIYAADQANLTNLRSLCPETHQHKLSLFLEDRPLPDPYHAGHEAFEAVLDLVEARAASLVSDWTRLAEARPPAHS